MRDRPRPLRADLPNRELVAPLVAELAAYRERLEDLARQNGTLTAELGQARARIAELERPPELVPAPDPSPELIPPTPDAAPWWRRLLPHVAAVVAVLAALALAAVLAPAWVR